MLEVLEVTKTAWGLEEEQTERVVVKLGNEGEKIEALLAQRVKSSAQWDQRDRLRTVIPIGQVVLALAESPIVDALVEMAGGKLKTEISLDVDNAVERHALLLYVIGYAQLDQRPLCRAVYDRKMPVADVGLLPVLLSTKS